MIRKIFACWFVPCFVAFAEVGQSSQSSAPQISSEPQVESSTQKSSQAESNKVDSSQADSSKAKSSEVESSNTKSSKASKQKSSKSKNTSKQKFSVHIFSSPLFSPPFAPITKDRQITSWSEMRDKNLTKQEYDYSCGAASLSSILEHYYGLENASEKEILDTVLLKKGIDINQKEEIQFDDEMKQKAHLSFYDMVGYAEDRGFRAFGLAVDLPALYELKAPVIIYVKVRNIEHFSVLKGIDSKFVYLADPSFGNIKVSVAKFVEMFYPKKTRQETREEKQQAKLAKKPKKSYNDEAESMMMQNHSQNRLMRGKIMAIVPNMQSPQNQAPQNENPQNQNHQNQNSQDLTTQENIAQNNDFTQEKSTQNDFGQKNFAQENLTQEKKDKDSLDKSAQADSTQAIPQAIPQAKSNTKPKINAEFMKLEKHSGFVYEGIKDMLFLRQ
ncbi:C39 family peptidase [Helicobacter macacae]|uniref:Peptidase C39 domain-containing protein n=1 Tax=Helicobacter macacae MIT 99-5501 TaxID=1357400 RepID=V8CEK9_9HELI|nr:C39 family peptidase [Helicobacter macacae]ETD25171.1 hypothetical protein HMPREF2086_00506 [Helicobacter macacae MIT 99-5501]